MSIRITVELDGEILALNIKPDAEREVLMVLHRALNTWEDPPEWVWKLHDRLRDKLGPMPPKMFHSCKCTAYNGGQCYNCLNGAHDLCDAGCKVPRSKHVGVMIVAGKKA